MRITFEGIEYEEEDIISELEKRYLCDNGSLQNSYHGKLWSKQDDKTDVLSLFYALSGILEESYNVETFERYRYVILGKFFSYPSCCIEFFHKHDDVDVDSKTKHHKNKDSWMGSGFIPCQKCSESLHTKQDTIELLDGRDPFIRYSRDAMVSITMNDNQVMQELLISHNIIPDILSVYFKARTLSSMSMKFNGYKKDELISLVNQYIAYSNK